MKKATRKSTKQETSEFYRVGRDAMRKAQRALLLKTLRGNGWHLTRTADSLAMGSSSGVIRALRLLAPDEYERAQEAGRIRRGRRRKGGAEE